MGNGGLSDVWQPNRVLVRAVKKLGLFAKSLHSLYHCNDALVDVKNCSPYRKVINTYPRQFYLKHSDLYLTTIKDAFLYRTQIIWSYDHETLKENISLPSRTLTCWEKKSRSRLELWDLENKILVLVSNLEIERNKILKSKRKHFIYKCCLQGSGRLSSQ